MSERREAKLELGRRGPLGITEEKTLEPEKVDLEVIDYRSLLCLLILLEGSTHPDSLS